MTTSLTLFVPCRIVLSVLFCQPVRASFDPIVPDSNCLGYVYWLRLATPIARPLTTHTLLGNFGSFFLQDTVNTASRMESTGRPGWIHASEQTAAELIAQGKHRWLNAREDQVVAKGKGELSTYWIVMPKRSRLGSVSTDDDDDNSQQSRDDLTVDVVGRQAVSVNASSLGRQLQSLQTIGPATAFTSPSVRSENRSVHC
jgi:HPt (histidine-containing phosphotransfer) domain-containing protein